MVPPCQSVVSIAEEKSESAEPAKVNGDSVIRGKAGESEIVIKTTKRLAGAIDSLTWNGMEFIDSFDHGRQLQSAFSFDGGSDEPFWAERFNPTEAGSRSDHTGDTSTSRLIRLHAADNRLETRVQMAFWLPPGEKSFGRPALNRTELSNHQLSKQVHIGWKAIPHAVEYQTTFHIADNEPHRFAQFEALTGYMPEHFNEFLTWNPKQNRLESLDDGPGEQALPIIFSTADKQHAMAIFCPEGILDQPGNSGEISGPTYGRFRFMSEKVVKWNCVFRLRNQPKIVAGDYKFSMFVIVGSLSQVQSSLVEIAKHYPGL
ncbi:MAG TPA: hypothetical protein DDZ51_21100 [Planctomycetaceae bacterium]|nr:hypothetical protein [Planctomycetaceae bacterium]